MDAARYSSGNPDGARFRVVGTGSWGSAASSGVGFTNTLSYVVVPHHQLGRLTAQEIARGVSDMTESGLPELAQLGRMLERVRAETSPATLLREGGGWAFPRERTARYGVAVLTLAVRLGDRNADGHLTVLQGLLRTGGKGC
ncbi:hypothetical protein [Deinococcus pimensis]|uniref:hypothetical protein n=1 Tax=Deinococcus pimensis TaxID=309888 RepID=UPI0004B61B9E|nr:hypothetical protein [Deinococcus pimensis]